MTNYTTNDFSEIHGPDEKPTVPGWYPSSVDLIDLEHFHYGKSRLTSAFFDIWDGAQWLYGDNDVCVKQSRYWFGLKNKP